MSLDELVAAHGIDNAVKVIYDLYVYKGWGFRRIATKYKVREEKARKLLMYNLYRLEEYEEEMALIKCESRTTLTPVFKEIKKLPKVISREKLLDEFCNVNTALSIATIIKLVEREGIKVINKS